MTKTERIECALECARINLRYASQVEYERFKAAHIADTVTHVLNAIVLTFQENALTDGDVTKLVRLVQDNADMQVPAYIIENSDRITRWHEDTFDCLPTEYLLDDADKSCMAMFSEQLETFISEVDAWTHKMLEK